MQESNQLNDNNNAYRTGHSTITAVMQITDAIYEATDANKIATIMTVDESAAFDCIAHKTLQDKLKLYKFSKNTREWFDSFLTYRSQYVSIGAKRSSIKTVKHGIPQGSMLGPLLFTIYVNELPELLQNKSSCKDDIHERPQEKLFPASCSNCGIISMLC